MHIKENIPATCNPSINRCRRVTRDGLRVRFRPRVASYMALTSTSTPRIIQKEKSFQLNKGVPRIQNHCHECRSQVARKVTMVATERAHSVPVFRNLKCMG